jgi:hypothetical protein
MSCTGYISCIGPPAVCDTGLSVAVIAGYWSWLLISVAGDIGSSLISVAGDGVSSTLIVAGDGTSPLFDIPVDCSVVTCEASSRARVKLSGTATPESRGGECSSGGILQSDVCCRSVFKNTEKSSV